VNPKSTSNQSSKPCTVLQYPSKKKTSYVTQSRMSHVTLMNKSSHTHDWLRIHTWMSHSHTWTYRCYIAENESVMCLREWDMSYIWICHEWVMSHIWTYRCYVADIDTHTYVACHTNKKNQSFYIYGWVMSYTRMSNVTHMNESCHTHEHTGVT